MKKQYRVFAISVVLIVAVGTVFLLRLPQIQKPSNNSFKAPGRAFLSTKKVEDYFVENMKMTPSEAKDARSTSGWNDGKVTLRLNDKATLDAVVNNLYYYGFIRDKKAFVYALENTKDTDVGKANAIKVGKNGTLDVGASYRISEDMDAWQIADVLLNKPTYLAYDQYGYLFMP